MKVHGQRVYLNTPVIPDTKLDLGFELKQELKQEAVAQFDRLTVFAVGEGVTNVKPGDVVFVEPNELKRAVFIKVGNEEKMVVSSFGIMHTW